MHLKLFGYSSTIGGEGTVLIQAAIGTNVAPYPEIHQDIDFIMAGEKM